MSKKIMTTTGGNKIGDNQNSITAGERGPLLVQDYQLIQKLAHQNRERVPERVVHAKGSAAYGELTITNDISKYTKAKVLQKGEKTRVLARFSTVAGEMGAADAERDVRGFALKFYTKEGNWDLVGNNTPVFFIRDGIKFPDFIHTQKRHPRTNLRSNTAMWDFWSLTPESIHQVTILMSDRGIPASFRHMHGFGSHTYSLINDKNERVWVKFHFKTAQGIKNLTNCEAAKVIGEDRESNQRDLYSSIEKGNFPKWNVKIQIMSEEQAKKLTFNPFDLTKVWPHKDFPLIDVGVMELNENPNHYFAEVEQACFSPANVVPGISYSPDKMLQARIFSYPDAQRYRVGTHYEKLPVNKPIVEVNTYNQNGSMLFDGPIGNCAYYEPNSFDGAVADSDYIELPFPADGNGYRYEQNTDDDFSQARALFNLMSDSQKDQLFSNFRDAMQGVPKEIIERQLSVCEKVHKDYAAGIRKKLGM